jgi:hypothetical protein
VVVKAILVQQMTGDDQRARQRGHNGKARGHQRRHMHRRFGNADHRPLRQLARRQQSRIAKQAITCPKRPADGRPDLLQHADGGDGFIKVAFNGRHPFPGETAIISVPGAAAMRAAARWFRSSRLVLGLITCIQTAAIRTPCRRQTAGQNQAGIHQPAQSRGWRRYVQNGALTPRSGAAALLPQQLDKLLVIVAAAALTPRRAPCRNH